MTEQKSISKEELEERKRLIIDLIHQNLFETALEDLDILIKDVIYKKQYAHIWRR